MAVQINTEQKTIAINIDVPGQQGPPGPTGVPGPAGPAGPANQLTVGTVSAGDTGTPASVTITGSAPGQVLNFVLPRGLTGEPGPQGAPGQDGTGIQIAGSVTTYSALPTNLSAADAGKGYLVQSDGLLYIWSGTAFPANGSGAQFRGPAGPANTLSIGTVLTGTPGSTASATITGTVPNQVLNLTIPTGATGAAGPGLATGGTAGSVLAKLTSTNYDTQWINSGSDPAPSTIAQRDVNGRLQVADPAVAADVATKNYIDTKFVPLTAKGVASGIATLDSTGKIPQAQIPAIAISDYLGTVASQAAMLALVGQRGDWVTRSDLSADFMLTADDPTKLANWHQITSPGGVTSVAGRIGAVTLGHADILDWDNAVKDSTFSGLVPGEGIAISYDDANHQIFIENTYTESIVTASPGSMRTVDKDKVTGFWPAGWSGDVPIYTGGSASAGVRPTARPDIIVIWRGADPSPGSVASGTGGMLRGVDERKIPTP